MTFTPEIWLIIHTMLMCFQLYGIIECYRATKQLRRTEKMFETMSSDMWEVMRKFPEVAMRNQEEIKKIL